jgi:GTP-binding protein LepA
MNNIRNFSIVAHINHGKSTLADRIIEISKNMKINSLKNQCLDTMELERERGITIKSQCVTLNYSMNKKTYILNLIDTPGHIDFGYEVLRSLYASDGIILLIDINKGIEAQTISHYRKAIENNKKIIFAFNKIDNIKVDKNQQFNDVKSILNAEEIFEVSAKTGHGVKELIEKLILNFPSPKCYKDNYVRALIIDSWFDNYKGVVCLIKMVSGEIQINEKIIILPTKKTYKINDIGIFTPEKFFKNILKSGEIGFISFACKNPKEINIGDTITSFKNPLLNNLKFSKKITPKIYTDIYPLNPKDFILLKSSINKLSLNDSSIMYILQNSPAFGMGYTCGFLGLLHLNIIKERLEREYNLNIIVTYPNVIYKIVLKNDEIIYINTPSKIPENFKIKKIYEPFVISNIISKPKYINQILELCEDSRGIKKQITFFSDNVSIEYYLPLSEIVLNFFENLQIMTNGFVSFDYDEFEYLESNLVKMSILINDTKIDSFTFMIEKKKSYNKCIYFLNKLSNLIPRQLFEIKIKSCIDNNIIASKNIKALRKNVLSKCYGGDISRKKKLLEKQKEGKNKMKKIGNVSLPKEIFFEMLNIKSDN